MQSTRLDLEDRVALVTGGARRIGAGIARALHAEGMRVVIHYRGSAQEARTLCGELNDLRPASALTVAGDLLDTASLPVLVEETLNGFGRLDVLVNNASSFYPTPIGEIAESDWETLVGSNLKAPLFLAQAATPALRASRGLIINLVDVYARRPLLSHPVYSVAKAGLAMLTLSLARELGPAVRVNGIAPGAILWPEQGMDETAKLELVRQTPLQRTGDPDDIARCAVFLARDGGFISGQIIAIDGGRSVGW